MYNKRKEKLKETLQAGDIEALLVTNPVNIRYITGFSGSSGIVIITKDKTMLFTDFRYIEQAKEQTKKLNDLIVIKHESPATKTLKEYLYDLNIKNLSFEKKHLTYEQYEKLKNEFDFLSFIPHSGALEQIRLQKDEIELNKIREACKIADDAFSYILSFIKPGNLERDVSLELEHYMKKNGADDIAFDIIVASGKRSSLPHGIASSKEFNFGDLVKMDFGAVYDGYCSDLSRTIILGEGNDKQKEIYNIVLNAQKNALNSIKPQMMASEADGIAREEINKAGYGENFGHGLGHGLGLEVHESPGISFNGKDVLKPGMVFTVEPGIYLPGFGGVRIEDTVILTDDGCVPLTKSTKELLVL
ncbi:M24 family metallopeptidase [Natranaerofaba carboxydovora]|uniref:M24 family metallopeptidase n=1 Tax=Natranaerofaba carboxydovora TaxID=2742683 RepID=UPI001F143D6C|nr:Xaa-Pro peptidase family protein [Natranaerofaba carboxydovora]UMZ73966.1 Aminopeptidase YpdF [Natranaerofaba carboxydovora]